MATRTVVTVRFENTRDTQIFFRELKHDGRKVMIRAGNHDTAKPDQPPHLFETSGRKFATEAEAKAEFEKMVTGDASRWKTQKRDELQVTEAARSPHVSNASNPELEEKVRRGGLDDARVLADWQLTHFDVRGDIASLKHAGKEADAQALLEQHAELLFGDLDVLLGNEVRDLVWRHGYLVGATLRRQDMDSPTDLAELTKTFLALPMCQFVTELRFGLASFESDNDWGPTMEAVAESPRASEMKSLRFDDYTYEDCEISWTAFGDFSPHWAKLPSLELLHIRSGEGGTLGNIDLPNLRTFIRESGGLAGEEIKSIVGAKWPKLERLDIWFGQDNYGAQGTVESIARVLDGSTTPALKHFGAINCEFTPALIPELARSPLLKQLEVVDLSKGVLADPEADLFISNAAAFKHLKKLDLRENLFEEASERLRQALPNVDLAAQREGGEEDRYTAVGE